MRTKTIGPFHRIDQRSLMFNQAVLQNALYGEHVIAHVKNYMRTVASLTVASSTSIYTSTQVEFIFDKQHSLQNQHNQCTQNERKGGE